MIELINNTTLTCLDLRSNFITDIYNITDMLKINSTITSLNLGNIILETSVQIDAIFESLATNKGLKILNLKRNQNI